jgi:transporter family protein
MNWIYIALLTVFSFGFYNFFIKLASGNISHMLGAFILQAVATVLGGGILLYMKIIGSENLQYDSKGILYSCLAGVFVGLAEIFSFVVFSKGAAASVATPFIVGGSIVVTALLGIIFLKEEIKLIQIGGMLLIIVGVVLLSAGK